MSFKGIIICRLTGVEQLVTRKERLHQDYFRRAVLANCEQQCVISHFSETSLIEAAHILPWSECREARLEVGNGLALNALLHAAFDENLLGISPDGVVKVSDALIRKSGGFHPIFSEINGARLDSTLMRQPPRRDFLDLRYQKFLASQ